MSAEMEKTLCNTNDIVSICDGESLCFNDQKDNCDAAFESKHSDACIHLCDNGRCDSHVARHIALQNEKER